MYYMYITFTGKTPQIVTTECSLLNKMYYFFRKKQITSNNI